MVRVNGLRMTAHIPGLEEPAHKDDTGASFSGVNRRYP